MNLENRLSPDQEDLVKSWSERLLAAPLPLQALPWEPGRGSRLPKRLWELDPKLLCPVVGTCLSMEEVRKVARKQGCIPPGAGDYEAHVTMVGQGKSRNPASEALQQCLDRRHALWVGRFAKARDEAAVLGTWQSALDKGEAAGALWGALTCRAATEVVWQRCYEDIHMLSHQVGAGVRADLARSAGLESEIGQLRSQLKRSGQRHDEQLASRSARIRYLELALAGAEDRARDRDELAQRCQALRDGQGLANLEQRLAEAEERMAQLDRQAVRADALDARVARLSDDNEKLAESLRLACAERDALERLLEEADEPDCAACGLEDACPARPHFDGRRLLCVGGRLNLQAQYRTLVEKAGGQFIFHDGGKEEALGRLPDLLSQADAVICPADNVGHPAYYQLKRHCKQAGKPCVLLRGSGLASFADGLDRLARGRSDIGEIRFPLGAGVPMLVVSPGAKQP